MRKPNKTKTKKKLRRGFAAMSEETKMRICRSGGKAVAKKRGKKWMAKIGAIGGANPKGGKGKAKSKSTRRAFGPLTRTAS